MGQKTNANAFRLAAKKNWFNPSFYSKFNYKEIINQDFIIKSFLTGFLKKLNFDHFLLPIRRTVNGISILIVFFNPNFNFDPKYLKNPIFFQKWRRNSYRRYWHLRKRYFRFFKRYKFKKKKLSLVLNSFNIVKSNNFNKKSIKYKSIVQSNRLIFLKLLKNHIKTFLNPQTNTYKVPGFKLKIDDFSFSKLNDFSLIKIKLFIIYVNFYTLNFYQHCKMAFHQVPINFLLKVRKYFILFSEHLSLYYKNEINVQNTRSSSEKFTGISLKNLLQLFISKIAKTNNIKINLLQLSGPNRKTNGFFHMVKKNSRVRGQLSKSIISLYKILYHSLKLNNPTLLSEHLTLLIRRNIKKNITMQVFRVLSLSFPYFCDIFGYKGIKLQLKGRINGAKRSRAIQIQYGQIPLSTISANIKYSYNKIMTIHGLYSLKIWYYQKNENTKKN